MPQVVCVLGTRPEAIKLAPVILRLREAGWAQVRVVHTGQHRHLADEVLELFGIVPEVDLDLIGTSGSLGQKFSRAVEQLDHLWARWNPDAVLVQGDTLSALAGGLSAFYRRICVGHVEAGLRTGCPEEPFPEEFHRRALAPLATWHFAPTPQAARNLLREGIPAQRIFLTGNPGIDAMQQVLAGPVPQVVDLPPGVPLVVITMHRREATPERVAQVAQAVVQLVEEHSQAVVAWVLHPRPPVAQAVRSLVPSHPRVLLLPPLEYPAFLGLLVRAWVVWTDSGGVQEETATLGVPCMVLRPQTERSEILLAHQARVLDADPEKLLRCTLHHFQQSPPRANCSVQRSPFGDGKAAERIARVLRRRLGSRSPQLVQS